MARDQALLEKAWHEAARASWLLTAPNPRVGALALAQGHVIGYGHHAVYGGSHAEEAALRDAGAWDEEQNRARPGVVDEVVVTLEPCSATGKKRPPCTQALLDAGVRRVVCAATDPDPRHQGAGLRVLEEAGVEVVQAEASEASARFAALNPAFLRGLQHPERPWVLLKWAASLDGKLAADDGTSQWITGPDARAEVHALRACSDAVAAGAGTLRADNPSLDARPQDGPPRLRQAAPTRQPLRVLVGGGDAVHADARIFAGEAARLWVLDPEQEPAAALMQHQDPILRVARGQQGLDLAAVLQALREQSGVRRLLVEGGARLHGSLLAAGLVDAVVRYEAPILLGGGRAACAGPSFASPQMALQLTMPEERGWGAELRRAFLVAPSEGENAR